LRLPRLRLPRLGRRRLGEGHRRGKRDCAYARPAARAYRRHLAGAAACPQAGAEFLAAALALVADEVLDRARELAHIAA